MKKLDTERPSEKVGFKLVHVTDRHIEQQIKKMKYNKTRESASHALQCCYTENFISTQSRQLIRKNLNIKRKKKINLKPLSIGQMDRSNI